MFYEFVQLDFDQIGNDKCRQGKSPHEKGEIPADGCDIPPVNGHKGRQQFGGYG